MRKWCGVIVGREKKKQEHRGGKRLSILPLPELKGKEIPTGSLQTQCYICTHPPPHSSAHTHTDRPCRHTSMHTHTWENKKDKKKPDKNINVKQKERRMTAKRKYPSTGIYCSTANVSQTNSHTHPLYTQRHFVLEQPLEHC